MPRLGEATARHDAMPWRADQCHTFLPYPYAGISGCLQKLPPRRSTTEDTRPKSRNSPAAARNSGENPRLLLAAGTRSRSCRNNFTRSVRRPKSLAANGKGALRTATASPMTVPDAAKNYFLPQSASPSSIRRSSNWPKSSPMVLASRGTRLVAVMPGSVLTSRSVRLSSGPRMKSALL